MLRYAVAFMCVCVGVLCIRLAIVVPRDLNLITQNLNSTTSGIAGNIKNTTQMLNGAIFQVEEVANSTNQLLEVERRAQVSQVQKTNAILVQVAGVLRHFDQNQDEISKNLDTSLASLSDLSKQGQDTLARTGGLTTQLQQSIVSLGPTIANINQTTDDIRKMSDAVTPVVQNAMKPKPWYKKVLGDVWVGVKLLANY